MYLVHFIRWLAGRVALHGEGGAHSPLSTEEIEKKLNIYHKGAKIWKMLIFCQVEPACSFLPRRRGQCGRGSEPKNTLHVFAWRECPWEGAFVHWVCAHLLLASR